jgi:hypothetical protein
MRDIRLAEGSVRHLRGAPPRRRCGRRRHCRPAAAGDMLWPAPRRAAGGSTLDAAHPALQSTQELSWRFLLAGGLPCVKRHPLRTTAAPGAGSPATLLQSLAHRASCCHPCQHQPGLLTLGSSYSSCTQPSLSLRPAAQLHAAECALRVLPPMQRNARQYRCLWPADSNCQFHPLVF